MSNYPTETMNQPDQLPALLDKLEDALNLEGFGCACTPMGQCATCKARNVMSSAWNNYRAVRASALAERARADALQANLARIPEAIRNTFSVPHSALRRGENGRCSRSTCLCEAEGLGAECVWLVPTDEELQRRTGEPHIDGYPLYSGLPTRADALQVENAKAKAMPMKYRRMEFNAQLQVEAERERKRADALEAALRTVRMRLEVAHRLLDIASGPSGARAAFKKIDEAIADIDTAARALLEKPHDR